MTGLQRWASGAGSDIQQDDALLVPSGRVVGVQVLVELLADLVVVELGRDVCQCSMMASEYVGRGVPHACMDVLN